MTKTRIILGLTMMVSVLAIAATPAAAKFRAVTPNATSGSSQLKVGNTASLAVKALGSAFTSSKAPDTWRIQDSKIEQRATKEGEHLDQEINFQEILAAAPAKVTVNNPVVVQFVQTGTTTSDVLISKNIVVSVEIAAGAVCTVKIPAASGAKNKQLTKAKDVNTEPSKALEVIAEITNINSTSEPNAICEMVGIEEVSTTGEFKAISIEHGVIQV